MDNIWISVVSSPDIGSLFLTRTFPSSSRESSLSEDKVKNLLLEKDAKINSMQAEIAKVRR